jgi:hypothetical protein
MNIHKEGYMLLLGTPKLQVERVHCYGYEPVNVSRYVGDCLRVLLCVFI